MYFNKIEDELINRIFDGFCNKPLYYGFNRDCVLFENSNKYIYDVLDDENEITVHLFVPGVDKDNINMKLTNDVLEVDVKQTKIDSKRYAIKNSKFGDFNVKFKLTDKHDKKSVESKLVDGVLIITIPKATTNTDVKIIDIK